MTQGPSPATIRLIGASIHTWTERYRTTPDPTSPPLDGLSSLSDAMRNADYAIQNVSQAEAEGEEWKSAMAAYRQVLREVRDLLADFEVRLRLRRSQMSKTGSHLAALKSWAELARFVG